MHTHTKTTVETHTHTAIPFCNVSTGHKFFRESMRIEKAGQSIIVTSVYALTLYEENVLLRLI